MSAILTATQVALVARLDADAPLSAALGAAPGTPKVFYGEARRGTVPPYVVFDGATLGRSERHDTFDAPAHDGTETFHVISPDRQLLQGKQIFALVAAALHVTPLPLPGHAQFEAVVEYLTDYLDPTEPIAHHVGRLRQTAIEAAA